jgi:hypothetical protein
VGWRKMRMRTSWLRVWIDWKKPECSPPEISCLCRCLAAGIYVFRFTCVPLLPPTFALCSTAHRVQHAPVRVPACRWLEMM